MYQTGALIVESSKLLIPALAAASRVVSKVLYIPLDYNSQSQPPNAKNEPPEYNLCLARQQIKRIYFEISKTSPLLDVRILLPPPTPLSGSPSKGSIPLQFAELDVVLSSLSSFEQVRRSNGYQLLAQRVEVDLEQKFEQLEVEEVSGQLSPNEEEAPAIKSFNDVVLGGTFDNIHNGHRLLLTQSTLVTKRRLLVGISTGPLLSSKVLPELIKPVANRIVDVESFLADVQPCIHHEVVGITDVYGPTISDAELECVVVSPETVRGAQMINTEREKKGLSLLAVHTIQIVDRLHSTSTLAQEQKLSSSDIRRGMLGSYKATEISTRPHTSGSYLIGLTGGIASGKSAILKRLGKKGACTIDCDKLGHDAYKAGTLAYSKIVETFGEGVLDENGEIDRKVLGPIVFSDKTKLEQLNHIVWPEIWSMVEQRVQEAVTEGYTVCVIDAAVMLSAGWHNNMNEIWVTIAPEKEVVTRIMDRDGLTEQAARSRMAAQPSNLEYVQQANVVFSTQWEHEYTQKQVDKAWDELQARISSRSARNHSTNTPNSQL